jgi:hypothetical protein
MVLQVTVTVLESNDYGVTRNCYGVTSNAYGVKSNAYGVTVVLQWWPHPPVVLIMLSPVCYRCVTGVLQVCYNSVTMVFQWCYSGVTVVLQ